MHVGRVFQPEWLSQGLSVHRLCVKAVWLFLGMVSEPIFFAVHFALLNCFP